MVWYSLKPDTCDPQAYFWLQHFRLFEWCPDGYASKENLGFTRWSISGTFHLRNGPIPMQSLKYGTLFDGAWLTRDSAFGGPWLGSVGSHLLQDTVSNWLTIKKLALVTRLLLRRCAAPLEGVSQQWLLSWAEAKDLSLIQQRPGSKLFVVGGWISLN